MFSNVEFPVSEKVFESASTQCCQLEKKCQDNTTIRFFFIIIIRGLAYKLEVLEIDHHLVLGMGRTIKHENKAQ